jgi:hypothetical protein
MPVSTLKYVAEKDQFESSNGTLLRIKDIKTPKESIYREWSGQEWRYFNDGDLVKTKENMMLKKLLNVTLPIKRMLLLLS